MPQNPIAIEDELIEITVVSELSLPLSITIVEAVRQAIFRQPWATAYPEKAQALYEALMQHPEMLTLLQQFPGEVSVAQLIAKINELIPQLLGYEGLSDVFRSIEDIPVRGGTARVRAYLEALWNALEPLVPDREKNTVRDALSWSHPSIQSHIYTYEQMRLSDEEAAWTQFTSAVEDVVRGFSLVLTLDVPQLGQDIEVLYSLFAWDSETEQFLIEKLSTALGELAETRIHIGGQAYPVPFLEEFEGFLARMQDRHATLTDLAAAYGFLPEETRTGWLDPIRDQFVAFLSKEGELYRPGLEWVFHQARSGLEGAFDVDFDDDPCYGLSPDECYEYAQLAGPRMQGQNALSVQIAEGVFVPLYNIAQLGTAFGDALQSDWKTATSALLGAISGMGLTLVGTMLGVDLILFAALVAEKGIEFGADAVLGEDIDVPISEALNSVTGFVAQHREDAINAIGLNSEAFQTGMDIGMLGMAVSESVVGVVPRTQVNHDIRISFQKKNWELQFPGNGGNLVTPEGVSWGGGGTLSVSIPVVDVTGGVSIGVVVQTIPISRRALFASHALMTGTGGSSSTPPEEPEEETTPEARIETPEVPVEIWYETKKQFPHHMRTHMPDWGLDIRKAADRTRFQDIIEDAFHNPDEIRWGSFTSQDEVFFFKKGEAVILTKPDGEFVTILQVAGGIPRFDEAIIVQR